jgi:hypothetical protein
MPISHKYPLPPLLSGILSVSAYDKWLNCKADSLRTRDLRLKRPFPRTCGKAIYKQKINAAILASDGKDPYSGDALAWDLLATRDKKGEALPCPGPAADVFNKDYFLMPTVDHCDPYAGELNFEICSWIVNSSKTLMNPREYVDLCKKVAKNRRA